MQRHQGTSGKGVARPPTAPLHGPCLAPSHQVFLTIEAALSARNITSTLLKLLKADPALAKAIADPTTNVTLFAPANKVRSGPPRGAMPLPARRRPPLLDTFAPPLCRRPSLVAAALRRTLVRAQPPTPTAAC